MKKHLILSACLIMAISSFAQKKDFSYKFYGQIRTDLYYNSRANEETHKEFEAGYEESEVDLRVIFDLIDGKWYVTDCYTGWYGYDLPIDDLNETVKQVKEENDTFKELHP